MIDQEELVCQEFVELVDYYLGETLTAQTRRRFEAHLAECPSCATYLEQMRLTIHAVSFLTPPTTTSPSRDELLRLFRERHRDATMS